MDDLRQRLAATLNTLLSLRGMSQTTLAQLAAMPRSQVNEYLKGSTLPQLPQLERLARALEVDLLTVFFTLSRIDDVRTSLGDSDRPSTVADRAGEVITVRGGGFLIKHSHPFVELVTAVDRFLSEVTESRLFVKHEPES